MKNKDKTNKHAELALRAAEYRRERDIFQAECERLKESLRGVRELALQFTMGMPVDDRNEPAEIELKADIGRRILQALNPQEVLDGEPANVG